MSTNSPSYCGYRFPSEIISHAVWLYYRFCLSYRDVEDLLARRGVIASHETIRQWCRKFGPRYASALVLRRGRLGDTWHLDELFVTIRGQRQDLWRAVDEDGDVIDILVQSRRDRRAAKRFFRKLLKGQGSEPRRLLTDKLRSYGAAHRTVMPSVIHETARYANNRAEVSHQPTRQRERQMRGFKSEAESATLPVRPRRRPEPVPSWEAQAAPSQPPDPASAFVLCLVRGDARLIGEGSEMPNPPRARPTLVKLTVPFKRSFDMGPGAAGRSA